MTAPTAVHAAALLAAFAPWARAVGDDPRATALGEVQMVEKLGERVPLDLSFTGAGGEPVRLREAFAPGIPVVLTLVYFQCQVLCNLLLKSLARALRESGLALGKDYRAVTVSFDPQDRPEDASERQRGFLAALGAPEQNAHWPFLTGREEEVRALAESVGFVYASGGAGSLPAADGTRATGPSGAPRAFAHAAVSFVLAPDGTIARYLYGVELSPRDVRLSLVEAAQGKVGTALDRVLLFCLRWDGALTRYRPFVFGFLRGGALLVFFGLLALLVHLWRREARAGTVR